MKEYVFRTITKKHSTTFYYASLFFPKHIRDDVYILYAFLRTADDLVDEKRDKEAFLKFKDQVYSTLDKNHISDDVIIDSFLRIFHKYAFEKAYLNSFFSSLESDFTCPLQILTRKELQEYIYGVAGVVGIMMAKIMGLPESFFHTAKEFGELMQLINIMRDINEDYQKHRVYIPMEDMNRYGLSDINDYRNKSKSRFENLIRFEITMVLKKMDKLSRGIENIPQPYRRPVKISRDVYKLVAHKIYKNPTLVWQTRVHISRFELFIIILRNLI